MPGCGGVSCYGSGLVRGRDVLEGRYIEIGREAAEDVVD
jgi:hypothetical protein